VTDEDGLCGVVAEGGWFGGAGFLDDFSGEGGGGLFRFFSISLLCVVEQGGPPGFGGDAEDGDLISSRFFGPDFGEWPAAFEGDGFDIGMLVEEGVDAFPERGSRAEVARAVPEEFSIRVESGEARPETYVYGEEGSGV
jgi:hypothetical protein